MEYLPYAALMIVVCVLLVLVALGAAKLAPDMEEAIREWRFVPVPDADATRRAEPVLRELADVAGVAAPRLTVVASLQSARRDKRGDGAPLNLGVTRMAPWRAPQIMLDRAALTDLSEAGLRALLGHELGHALSRRSTLRRCLPLAILAVFIVTLAGVLITTWRVAGEAWVPSAVVIYGSVYLGAWSALGRREELEADRIAVELTREIDGTEELLARYANNPAYAARGPWWHRVINRCAHAVLASHPRPQERRSAARTFYARL